MKAEVSQILLDRAFTQSIATGENIKPWGWADTWPVAQVRVPTTECASHCAAWRDRRSTCVWPRLFA